MNFVRVIDEIFSQIDGPRFSIRLWDNQVLEYGSGSKKLFTIVISDEYTAKRLLSQGSIGFGESYMDGRLRIEGDVEAYIKLRWQLSHVKKSLRLAVATMIAKRSVPRARTDQIAYHYDLGNDFFELFLDAKSMSYSAGLYNSGEDTLGLAQERKLELVCDWLDMPKDASVLDLGFGWGGFAAYAARTRRWHTTGYTLSKAQLEYSQRIVAKKSLEKYVTLEYRDMLEPLPAGQFDGIVMIEAIEHVGKDRLEQLFHDLYARLKPGGVLYIQTTGQYVHRRVDAWTIKYVFPGGYLPAKQELIDHSESAGFAVEEFRDNTSDYIRTMTTWITALEQNKDVIEQKFDASFYRLWELWTHGAKVAFELESMSLFRIRLRKPK